MLILLLVLVVFTLLWWYGRKEKDDLTKAEYLSKFGQDKFIQQFGKKELEKMLGRKI